MNYNIESYDNIKIYGDEIFCKNTIAALNLINKKSKNDFITINKYLGKITQDSSSGVSPYEDPPNFYVGKLTYNSSVTWYASAIAHDSFHSLLYNDYKKIYRNVPHNIWSGFDAEMKCLEFQIGVLERIDSPQFEIDYAKSLRGTNWWSGPITW